MLFKHKYQPPAVTAQIVVFCVQAGQLQVLLCQPSSDGPAWQLPGGDVSSTETTYQVVEQAARTQAGLVLDDDLGFTQQLYTYESGFGTPQGGSLCVTYLGCTGAATLRSGEQPARFWPVDNLPGQLAQTTAISDARYQLGRKITRSNAACSLLSAKFTLSQLQGVYEAVLGEQIDKRNFRKKFLARGLVRQLDEYWREGAHRPAQLYEFINHDIRDTAGLVL